jgi:uncharacterized membrane protein YfcA
MSGLLGVGGGTLIVPSLAYLFEWQQFPQENIMHLAIGTSLAVIFISTLRALYAHRRYLADFWSIYRHLLLPVIIGTVIGAIAAHFLHSNVLSLIFGSFVFLVSIKMFLGKALGHRLTLPGQFGMWTIGLAIGGKSGLLGVGGGALAIPFLTHCNVSIRTAVAVSIGIGITVSLVGSLTVSMVSFHVSGLPPWSTGYIYWPAWAGVSLGSLLMVPVGAALSHRLPVAILRRIFAFFLLIISVHMIASVVLY